MDEAYALDINGELNKLASTSHSATAFTQAFTFAARPIGRFLSASKSIEHLAASREVL